MEGNTQNARKNEWSRISLKEAQKGANLTEQRPLSRELITCAYPGLNRKLITLPFPGTDRLPDLNFVISGALQLLTGLSYFRLEGVINVSLTTFGT